MPSGVHLSSDGAPWLPRASLVIWLAAASACGGRNDGAGTDGGTLDANGGDGAPKLDLGDAATPCDRYFAAIRGLDQAGQPTSGRGLPAEELVRIRARFERTCEDQMALPGSGMTAAALAACGAAIAVDVDRGVTNACDIRGSLAGGAPCNDGVQCQSGSCASPFRGDLGAENPPVPYTCGTCAPAASLGQPCVQTGGCVEGAVCSATMPDASDQELTCLAITVGAAGAPCDDLSSRCDTGLYCDPDASTCATPGQLGDACGNRPCAPPLNCWGSPDVYACRAPAPAGARCAYDGDCAPGLGCTSTEFCREAIWAAPGETCSPPASQCLIGTCSTQNMVIPPVPPSDGGLLSGTCPTVIPDGKPCDIADPFTTCDTFSQCFQETCALIDSVVCR